MRKGIVKFAAFLLTGAVVFSAIPATEVSASSFFDSLMPAAGGALATGSGTSVQDIKADVAKSNAKHVAAATHSSIHSTLQAKNGANDQELANSNVPVVIKDKVETPASKAMEDAQAGMESVVGIAAEAAAVLINEIPVENVAEVTDTIEASEVTEETVEANEGEEGTLEGEVAEPTEVNAEAVAENAEVVPDAIVAPSLEVKPEAQDVEEGEEDLSGTIIAQVQSYVNVRATPSEEGEIVGKLYNESAGEWLGKEGDWYKIKSGNCTGYVKSEYVVTGQAAIELAAKVGVRTAVVNTTTLKVRQEPSLDATVLGLVGMEDRLTVLEENDEWVKVSIEEGDGYLSKEYLNIYTEFTKAESKAEEEARLAKEEAERQKANAAAQAATKKQKSSSSGYNATYSGSVPGSGLGSQVANYALQFVGNPYVYGGTSLTNGTDCSGFTMGVYKNFGVSLPHSSGAQRSVGYDVGGLANAQPGDLVCYSGHVALYIGNGQIVHASTAKTGIKVSNAAYRQVLAVRRIF